MKNIKITLSTFLFLGLYTITACTAGGNSGEKSKSQKLIYLDNFKHVAKGETVHISVGLKSNNKSSYDFNVSTNNQKNITVKKDDNNCHISNIKKCSISVTGVEIGNTTFIVSPVDTSIKPISQDITVSKFSVKELSINDGHSCLVNFDKQVYCWGDNSNGSLGNGKRENITTLLPTDSIQGLLVDDSAKFIPGIVSTNIVVSNNQIIQWGGKIADINSDGKTVENNVATTINLDGGINDVTTIVTHDLTSICAIKKIDNKVYCWGNNYNGQMGRGGDVDQAIHSISPINSNLQFSKLSHPNNGDTVCAITIDQNHLFCWGSNQDQIIIDNTSSNITTPTEIVIPGSGKIVNASVGLQHICALRASGDIYCWGNNSMGQLGIGDNNALTVKPTLVNGGMKFISIVTTEGSSCAISNDKQLYCWGIYGPDQLKSNVPTLINNIPGNPKLAAVSIFNYDIKQNNGMTIAAITEDGMVYAWGNNSHGRLATGDEKKLDKPTLILK
jgi:alpha-tubulin suppressor-like RCC1 family protein